MAKRKILRIYPERAEVKYRGIVYQVSIRAIAFLMALNERPFEWIAGSKLKKNYDENLSRVKRSLPRPIRELIVSHTHKGYRLTDGS